MNNFKKLFFKKSFKRLYSKKSDFYSIKNPYFVLTNISLVGVFAGLYFWDWDQKRIEKQQVRNTSTSSKGSSLVGGTFTLVETKTGKPITDTEFRGKFMFVYFGFTACPDICPTELNKMTSALKKLPKEILEYVQPIFITCDPARDSRDAIEKYLKDYHPNFIGLTGTPEQIRHASKKYRVYYSGPIKEFTFTDEDYQVDHSIFEYFMDPSGRLVEFFSRTASDDEIVSKMTKEIKKYKEEINEN
eukprot:gene5103-8701_t